jgi:hypothetical protein
MANGGVWALAGSVMGGLVGGVLTLGTSVVVFEQSRNSDEFRIAQNKVGQFAPDLDRRLGMTAILHNVLKDSTSREELLEQKLRYDEGYLRWGENIYLHAQAAGVILSTPELKEYSNLLENRLVSCMLRPIDAYITDWYRCRINAKDNEPATCTPPTNTPTCGQQSATLRILKEKARTCGTALADYLNRRGNERQSAVGRLGFLPGADAEQGKRKDTSQIWKDAEKACALGKRDPVLSGISDNGFTNLSLNIGE